MPPTADTLVRETPVSTSTPGSATAEATEPEQPGFAIPDPAAAARPAGATAPSHLYPALFDRLERARWELRDIDFSAIQRDRLPDQWVHDLRQICLTELSALYATEMFLRDFYADIDFCSFVSVWFYEEMKHYLTLRTYLEHIGEEFDDIDELPKLRLTFAQGPAIETLTMHYVGEQRLAHWYTAFSKSLEEPVLAGIFRTLAADELRHAACYASYLRKAVANNPACLPDIMKMTLWMLRSSNDAPKHPTTITEPSVVGQLEDPGYIRRMLLLYLPGRDHEAPVRRRVLAVVGELAGVTLRDTKDLLPLIRAGAAA